MKLPFHLKLERMCKVGRLDKHWVLTGSKTVRLPDSMIVVTTKRAIYAAFVGPIPGKHEVVASCGLGHCVAPDHQELQSRVVSQARGVSVPGHVEALSQSGEYVPRDLPGILPKGITIKNVRLVKFYTAHKNSMAELRHATGLPLHEIMKIRNGVYDGALKNVLGGTTRRRSDKSLRSLESGADIPGSLPAPPLSHSVEAMASFVPDGGITEEEKQWLGMMK